MKKVLNQAGEEISVVFIDTEGLNDLGNKKEHDTRIFMLALLLSSHMIYNCFHNFDRTQLEQLGLTIKVAEQISVNKQKQEENKQKQADLNFSWEMKA